MSNDRSPAELVSDFVAADRAAARVEAQPAALTTLLRIGDKHFVLLGGRGYVERRPKRQTLAA